MGDRVKDLLDVKLGDQFLINRRYGAGDDIVTCTKISPQQAEIGHWRYWKKNASGMGGSSWSLPPTLYHVTPEALERIGLRTMREKLKATKWEEVPEDQVRSIHGQLYPEKIDERVLP